MLFVCDPPTYGRAEAGSSSTIPGRESPIRELAFTRNGRGLIVNAGPAPILWSLAPKDTVIEPLAQLKL